MVSDVGCSHFFLHFSRSIGSGSSSSMLFLLLSIDERIQCTYEFETPFFFGVVTNGHTHLQSQLFTIIILSRQCLLHRRSLKDAIHGSFLYAPWGPYDLSGARLSKRTNIFSGRKWPSFHHQSCTRWSRSMRRNVILWWGIPRGRPRQHRRGWAWERRVMATFPNIQSSSKSSFSFKSTCPPSKYYATTCSVSSTTKHAKKQLRPDGIRRQSRTSTQFDQATH